MITEIITTFTDPESEVTLVMTGVQWPWVQTDDGHWLARVQRPSHQPHSVTRDDSKQDVQVVS